MRTRRSPHAPADADVYEAPTVLGDATRSLAVQMLRDGARPAPVGAALSPRDRVRPTTTLTPPLHGRAGAGRAQGAPRGRRRAVAVAVACVVAASLAVLALARGVLG